MMGFGLGPAGSQLTQGQLLTQQNDQAVLDQLAGLPALDSTVGSDQATIAQWGAPTAAQLNASQNVVIPPMLQQMPTWVWLAAAGLFGFAVIAGGRR